ncbi:hypothetical protein DAEQUDRAFT_599970 [Daedalea quercina L-15889]|uniref:Uncharacterized protein n=1 Tax=Daedalea quercina L-15889 TaxID=1314783 RepID=A0A165LND8_9APHY|nr:hypothetical protein DAEQUDRAFT_599970 [Daedalea quercina L-15889]
MRFMYPQRPSPAVYHVRRSSNGLHDMYWSGGYYPTAPEMRTVYSQPAMQPQMIYNPQLPPQRHYLSRMNRPYYPPVLCCDTCCGGICCDACCDDLCCDSCCGCGLVPGLTVTSRCLTLSSGQIAAIRSLPGGRVESEIKDAFSLF